MKNTLLVIVALLVGGCASMPTKPIANTPKRPMPWPSAKVEKAFIAIPRQITEEEKRIVGTYGRIEDEDTFRMVFLENGIAEVNFNGKKDGEETNWSMSKDGELYIEIAVEILGNVGAFFLVLRVNKDSSLTGIAVLYPTDTVGPSSTFIIGEGVPKKSDFPHIRKEFLKEEQLTFKKIK